MRLGQLSRKLSIKPANIVEDIQVEFDVTIEAGLNTKIDDKFVDFIEKKYTIVPEVTQAKEEVIEEKVVPEEKQEDSPTKEETEKTEASETTEEEKTEVVSDSKTSDKEEGEEEEIETIKAPKVKLEGIKVVDKIDLPEPKPQFIEIDGVIVDKAEYKKSQEFKKKEEERKRRAAKRAKDLKDKMERKIQKKEPDVNEFAVKKKDQKEKEQLLEKRRIANEKREKEMRKQHYHSKVANASTTPKPKKKKKVVKEPVKEEAPIVHKNWLAKLIHWFKTE